jgi:hypothetical protein
MILLISAAVVLIFCVHESDSSTTAQLTAAHYYLNLAFVFIGLSYFAYFLANSNFGRSKYRIIFFSLLSYVPLQGYNMLLSLLEYSHVAFIDSSAQAQLGTNTSNHSDDAVAVAVGEYLGYLGALILAFMMMVPFKKPTRIISLLCVVMIAPCIPGLQYFAIEGQFSGDATAELRYLGVQGLVAPLFLSILLTYFCLFHSSVEVAYVLLFLIG